MLGQIFHKSILSEELSPKPNSRSSKNSKIAVTSITSFHVKRRDLGVIHANVLKCKRSRKPTEDQYIIQCTSWGIDDCGETFFVLKKWLNLRPVNSYVLSDAQIIHWGHRFKRLHELGEIANNTLKMADNHLRYLHCHHLLRHGSRIFYYFEFDNMNRIKGITKTKIDKIEFKMK